MLMLCAKHGFAQSIDCPADLGSMVCLRNFEISLTYMYLLTQSIAFPIIDAKRLLVSTTPEPFGVHIDNCLSWSPSCLVFSKTVSCVQLLGLIGQPTDIWD